METTIDTTTSASTEYVLKTLSKEEVIERQQAACDAQKHLHRQTLDNFDPSLITPLNPEIISR